MLLPNAYLSLAVEYVAAGSRGVHAARKHVADLQTVSCKGPILCSFFVVGIISRLAVCNTEEVRFTPRAGQDILSLPGPPSAEPISKGHWLSELGCSAWPGGAGGG